MYMPFSFALSKIRATRISVVSQDAAGKVEDVYYKFPRLFTSFNNKSCPMQYTTDVATPPSQYGNPHCAAALLVVRSDATWAMEGVSLQQNINGLTPTSRGQQCYQPGGVLLATTALCRWGVPNCGPHHATTCSRESSESMAISGGQHRIGKPNSGLVVVAGLLNCYRFAVFSTACPNIFRSGRVLNIE